VAAFLGEHFEGVAEGGAGAAEGAGFDAEASAEFVGDGEADAVDLGGEAVGVFADDGDGVVAVGFVDADGLLGAEAVLLERTAFCWRQESRMRAMRWGPMPLIWLRKVGLSSMT
jgi:hypothetical protein